MKKIINGLVVSIAFACSLPVMASSHTSIADLDSSYLTLDLQTAGVPHIKLKPLQTAGVPHIKVKPLQTA
ncbi:hypothetical protein AB4135_21730, partial [Shewanella sp. 10N.286.54.B9]